jgi:hypothetical protein
MPKFEKGSKEAKDYMAGLRSKRGMGIVSLPPPQPVQTPVPIRGGGEEPIGEIRNQLINIMDSLNQLDPVSFNTGAAASVMNSLRNVDIPPQDMNAIVTKVAKIRKPKKK